MKRIIPVAVMAFAVVSTGVAVAFAASMPTPEQLPVPSPAGLAPQNYVTTSPTVTSTGVRAPAAPSIKTRAPHWRSPRFSAAKTGSSHRCRAD